MKRLLISITVATSLTSVAVAKVAGMSYVPWAVNERCLVAKALSPQLRICLRGQGQQALVRGKIKRALDQWLEPLRAIDTAVSGEVVFSCQEPDGFVTVHPGRGGAYGGYGSVTIYDRSHHGTILHEFGHAFACLGDTYLGGRAGYCMVGQPHSVMCDGLLRDDLSEDDVRGVRNQFQRYFRR